MGPAFSTSGRRNLLSELHPSDSREKYKGTLNVLREFTKDHFDPLTHNLASEILKDPFFSGPPFEGCYSPEDARKFLKEFLNFIHATDLRDRPKSREVAVPWMFAAILGKVCDDAQLDRFLGVHQSTYSEPAERMRAFTEQHARRCFSRPIRFRLERLKKCTAYVLKIIELDATQIPTPEAFALHPGLRNNEWPEPWPNNAESTEAVAGFEDSLLCAGTVLIYSDQSGMPVNSVLVLGAQPGVNTDSFGFHWIGVNGIHTRTGSQILDQVQVTGSQWKLGASGYFRAKSVHGELVVAPVIGEPHLSLWALGEHYARTMQSRKDIFYKLDFNALRPSLDTYRVSRVRHVIIALEDTLSPHSYKCDDNLFNDFSAALISACEIAGERNKDADALRKSLATDWVATIKSDAWRVCLPKHGPITDIVYGAQAKMLTSAIEEKIVLGGVTNA